MTCSSVSGVKSPVGRPLQVAPPSSVRMSVPNAPAAYPRAPAKSIAEIVEPVGVGLPQVQPEVPTRTLASASAGAVSAAAAHSAATSERRGRRRFWKRSM